MQKSKTVMSESKSDDQIIKSNAQNTNLLPNPIFLTGHKIVNSSIPSQGSFIDCINQFSQDSIHQTSSRILTTPFSKPQCPQIKMYSNKQNEHRIFNCFPEDFNPHRGTVSVKKSFSWKKNGQQKAKLSLASRLLIEQSAKKLTLSNKQEDQNIDSSEGDSIINFNNMIVEDLGIMKASNQYTESIQIDQKQLQQLLSPEKSDRQLLPSHELSLLLQTNVAQIFGDQQKIVVSQRNSEDYSSNNHESGISISLNQSVVDSHKYSPQSLNNNKQSKNSSDGCELLSRLKSQLSSHKKNRQYSRSSDKDLPESSSEIQPQNNQSLFSQLSVSQQKSALKQSNYRKKSEICSSSQKKLPIGYDSLEDKDLVKNSVFMSEEHAFNNILNMRPFSYQNQYPSTYTQDKIIPDQIVEQEEQTILQNSSLLPQKYILTKDEQRIQSSNYSQQSCSSQSSPSQKDEQTKPVQDDTSLKKENSNYYDLNAKPAYFIAMEKLTNLKKNIKKLQSLSVQTCKLIYHDSKISVISPQQAELFQKSNIIHDLEKELKAILQNQNDQVQIQGEQKNKFNILESSQSTNKSHSDKIYVKINGQQKSSYQKYKQSFWSRN